MGDFTAPSILNYPYQRGHRRTGEGLFAREYSNRTRRKGFKVREGRFTLGIRKKYLNVSMVRKWNRLPREVVDLTTLEVLRTRLHRALYNLV